MICHLDKERRVLFRVVIVAQSPACAAGMVPHALGLHQGPGPSVSFSEFTRPVSLHGISELQVETPKSL